MLQTDRPWTGRNIPSLNRPEDAVNTLKFWQRNLHRTISRPPILRAPFNFAVTSQRGGILLSWRPNAEANGYEILRSTNGDFSNEQNNLVTLSVDGSQFASFFDGVSGSGGSVTQKRYYRIRAVSAAGDASDPIKGELSGVLSATSIDPSDTGTASVTTRDSFGSGDPIAAQKNRWRAF